MSTTEEGGLRPQSAKRKPRDLRVLFGALAVGLGLLVFLLLAAAVQSGWTISVDNWILRSVRELALRNDRPGRLWAEESVIAITSLGTVAILAFVSCTVFGFLLLTRRYRLSALLGVSLLGGIGLNSSLKPLFGRARPDVVPRVQRVESFSFPSGHALIATAVYASLAAVGAHALRERRLRIYVVCVAAVLCVGIGLSRIYLGVHYPTDVLAGWAVGLAWALLCWLGLLCWEKRALQRDQ